jgi:hypothetical protein
MWTVRVFDVDRGDSAVTEMMRSACSRCCIRRVRYLGDMRELQLLRELSSGDRDGTQACPVSDTAELESLDIPLREVFSDAY